MNLEQANKLFELIEQYTAAREDLLVASTDRQAARKLVSEAREAMVRHINELTTG